MQMTHFSQAPSTEENNSSEINPSWSFNLQAMLSTCAANACIALVVIVAAGGVAALFSTAFSTCSKVSLSNKTQETITINSIKPFGSDLHSYILLPYASMKLEFNGVNSYLDLETSAGKMHFLTDGTSNLKEGANNKALKNGSPAIVFWTCNQNYVKTHPSSNTTSAIETLAEKIPYINLSGFFAKTANSQHLRGSVSQIEDNTDISMKV